MSGGTHRIAPRRFQQHLTLLWMLAQISAWSGVAVAKEAVSKYVGADKCGSCHVREYEDWAKSAHAQSYNRLPAESRKDAGCLTCHSTAASSGFLSVSCESCHGPGHQYFPEFIMKDLGLARALGLEVISARTCETCHTPLSPTLVSFDFGKAVTQINHQCTMK